MHIFYNIEEKIIINWTGFGHGGGKHKETGQAADDEVNGNYVHMNYRMDH